MPRPLHCVLSMPRTTLKWRKSRTNSQENSTQAAKRVKVNEDRRIENDHAEDTASREECNDQRRVENDNAEDAARRVKDNLVKKLRKRRLVQEQREAFQSRADKLLASLPEHLRRLCLSTFHID